jgi:nitric oxide reductase NorE protein
MDNPLLRTENTHGQFFYPPGGILMWIIVLVEITTFLAASLLFMYVRSNNSQEFSLSQSFINPYFGVVNTLVLITSGFFMANAIQNLRVNLQNRAAREILLSMILGGIFLLIKGYEYQQKLASGIDLGFSTFFTFYWLMTGFHFVHVLFGVSLLAYMYLQTKSGKYTATNMEDVEASAIYWHMCDLIWILIFPIFYLM